MPQRGQKLCHPAGHCVSHARACMRLAGSRRDRQHKCVHGARKSAGERLCWACPVRAQADTKPHAESYSLLAPHPRMLMDTSQQCMSGHGCTLRMGHRCILVFPDQHQCSGTPWPAEWRGHSQVMVHSWGAGGEPGSHLHCFLPGSAARMAGVH